MLWDSSIVLSRLVSAKYIPCETTQVFFFSSRWFFDSFMYFVCGSRVCSSFPSLFGSSVASCIFLGNYSFHLGFKMNLHRLIQNSSYESFMFICFMVISLLSLLFFIFLVRQIIELSVHFF